MVWFVGSAVTGVVDCIVVRVVVMLRNDGAGEENVLSLSPSVRAIVLFVPAPECVVSAVVASVGARDLGGFVLFSAKSCDNVVDARWFEKEDCREWEPDSGTEDVFP